MENAISNYSLVVIEDGQVPLAASFETASKFGSSAFVILAVALMAVLVAFIAYTVWYSAHKARVLSLVSRRSNIDSVYYFIHPLRLLELEYEAEHNTVNQYFD